MRGVLAALVPGMLHRQASDRSVPAITALRRSFVGFIASPVLIVLVLAFAVDVTPTNLDDPRAWGLLGLGLLTSVGGPSAAQRRRIVCAAPASIARQVGAAMFFGVATAQSAALLGFVAAFVIGSLWPYLVALFPTAFGMMRTAPTRRRIVEFDRQLQMVGCNLSASEVLYAHPGDPASPAEETTA